MKQRYGRWLLPLFLFAFTYSYGQLPQVSEQALRVLAAEGKVVSSDWYIPLVAQPNFVFPYRGITNKTAVYPSPSILQGVPSLKVLVERASAPARMYLSGQFPIPATRGPLKRAQSLFSKEHIDAFIFDLDGTLLNSLSAWDNAATNYLRSRGIEPDPGLQQEIEELSLLDGARIIKERYQLPEPTEELIEAVLFPVGEHYYHDIPAKEKVPALLAHLHLQGIKMAVATASHPDFARGALERLGLLPYFEFIITCDEVGIGKRSPRVYEEAIARLGTQKNRTVVVEDAFYALKTAHDAGFKTVGVAEPHSSKEDVLQIQQTAHLFVNFDK